MRGEKVMHIVGMLFLDAQDALQHCPGAGIVVDEITDQLAVMVDRNALGDQILACEQPLGIEVGLAAQLIDAFGNLSQAECIKRRRS